MSNYATLVTPSSSSGGGPGGGVALLRFNGVDYAPNQAGVVEFEQVQADWNATVGPAFIQNKPALFSGLYGDLTDKPDLSPLATAVQTGQNLGTGYNIYAGKTGTTLNFKLLQAGTNIALAQDGETISISAVFPEYTQEPSDWDATTGPTRILNKPDLTPMTTAMQGGENVGTGQNIFKAVVNKILQFRGIKAGSNVTLALDGDDIVINSTGGGGGPAGEANTASSSGTGASIVLPKNGVDLPFRSFLAGVGLEWVVATDTITAKLHKILEGLVNLGSTSANQLIYATGDGVFNTTTLSAYGRTLIDDADAPAARTTLGLGSAATRNVGTGAFDLAENQALGTMARAATTDYLALGQFGYGRPIVSDETNLNNYQTEGLYIGPSAGITNGPSQLPALSRPIIRVIQRFGYISQEILDTQGFRTFCWRAATTATLANTPWNVGRDIPDIQSDPMDLSSTTKLAKVGMAGFGGTPFFFPAGTTLADTINGSHLGGGTSNYTKTTVFRWDNAPVDSGLALYSPVLHLSGADTWTRLQIQYNTGLIRFTFGYAANQLGSGQVWTTLNFDPKGIPISNVGGSAALTAALVANNSLYFRFTGAGAVAFSIPNNSTEAIPIGVEVTVRRAAAGNLTITPASGVVINPPAGGTLVMTQNMTATLKKVGTNEWDLIGQTVAA